MRIHYNCWLHLLGINRSIGALLSQQSLADEPNKKRNRVLLGSYLEDVGVVLEDPPWGLDLLVRVTTCGSLCDERNAL